MPLYKTSIDSYLLAYISKYFWEFVFSWNDFQTHDLEGSKCVCVFWWTNFWTFYLVEVNVSSSNFASNLLYFDLNVNSDLAEKTCLYYKKSRKLFFSVLIWTFFTFSEHEVLANISLVCVNFRYTDIIHILTSTI